MGRTVAEAKAAVAEREFGHWRAKFAREPDGVEQLNWWMGQVLAVLVNVHRAKNAPAVSADDLIPDPWGERAAARPPAVKFKGKALDDMLRAWAGGGSGA